MSQEGTSPRNGGETNELTDIHERKVGDTTYFFVRELGGGKFGVVELVQDRQGNKFALKSVPLQTDPKRQEELDQALRDEIEILRAIDRAKSPVFAKFVAADISSEPKLLMEYIAGESLFECTIKKPLNEEQLRELMATLAAAAAIVHGPHKDVWVALTDQPQIHGWGNALLMRDINPNNVMVTDSPRRPYVVIDNATTKGYEFRRFNPAASTALELQPIGTPPFDDPVATAEGTPSHSSDVYAIAATCLEAGLPGGIPKAISDEVESLVGNAFRDRTPLDRSKPWPLQELALQVPVGDEFKQLLFRCLSLNPNERPADARELIGLLRPRVDTAAFRVDAAGEAHLNYEFLYVTERQRAICEQLVEASQFDGTDYWETHRKIEGLLKDFITVTKQPDKKIAKLFGQLIGGLLQSVDLSIENDEMKRNKLAHPFLDVISLELEKVINAENLIDAIARHKDPKGLMQAFYRPELINIARTDDFKQALVDVFDANPASPSMKSLVPFETSNNPRQYSSAQRAALLPLFDFCPAKLWPIAAAAFEGQTHREIARQPEAIDWLALQLVNKQLEPQWEATREYVLRALSSCALGALGNWLSTDRANYKDDPGPVEEKELTFTVRNRLKQLVIEGAKIDVHNSSEKEKLEVDLSDFVLERIHGFKADLDFDFARRLKSLLRDEGLAERPHVALVVLEAISESDDLKKIPNLTEPFIRNRLDQDFINMKVGKRIDVHQFVAELELFSRLLLTRDAKQRLLRKHQTSFRDYGSLFPDFYLSSQSPVSRAWEQLSSAWKNFSRSTKE